MSTLRDRTLNHFGKVNKNALMRPLVEAEMSKGTEDWKKVVETANILLSRFPAAQREGVEVTRNDVDRMKSLVRHHGKKQRRASAQPQPQTRPLASTDEQYTVAELRAAAAFFGSCGRSVVMARKLIDLVSSLTQGE